LWRAAAERRRGRPGAGASLAERAAATHRRSGDKPPRPVVVAVQETAVSYRAQRPSHLWHIFALITPITMCVIIDLIPILALMPMPYYIFPNALSEPKARRGDALPAPASLLYLRAPWSDVLLCVPSAAPASSQTQRPLCPERSQKKKIHLFPVCVAGAVIRHWSCRSSTPKEC
jgi:hypothetical protein